MTQPTWPDFPEVAHLKDPDAKRQAAAMIAEHFDVPLVFRPGRSLHFAGKATCLLKISEPRSSEGSYRYWTSMNAGSMAQINKGAALARVLWNADNLMWIPAEVFLSWTPQLAGVCRQGVPDGYELKVTGNLELITQNGPYIDLKPYLFQHEGSVPKARVASKQPAKKPKKPEVPKRTAFDEEFDALRHWVTARGMSWKTVAETLVRISEQRPLDVLKRLIDRQP